MENLISVYDYNYKICLPFVNYFSQCPKCGYTADYFFKKCPFCGFCMNCD